jgi:hypothetical protein
MCSKSLLLLLAAMGLPSRHIYCSSKNKSILLLLLFLYGTFALTCSTFEEVQAEQEETATTTTTTLQVASASRAHHNYSVVMKKHEKACVVGRGDGEGDVDTLRACYYVELYLKDVDAKRNHFHSLH